MIGSFLRKDHPLFAQRLRQAARQRRADRTACTRVHDDWLMPMAAAHDCRAERLGAGAGRRGGRGARPRASRHRCRRSRATPAQAIAASLLCGERKAVLLGNAAAQHPQAGGAAGAGQWIAAQTGATVGFLGEAANTVGAQLVGAMPGAGGLNAGQMLAQPLQGLLLLDVEPVLDAADAAAARAALRAAEMVVALTSFKDAAVENADVLLPIAPFTETAGSFVNAEGRAQSFHGVVKPLGETRPAWKVLRVLGNLLGLPGFEPRERRGGSRRGAG